MADISFEINGRKVSPSSVADALEKAILQGVSDSIKQSVGSGVPSMDQRRRSWPRERVLTICLFKYQVVAKN